ncbi:restriction endonuclease subunit S [Burkholderia pseudomallei]|uniref:restriction endonuclease subunit S n=2 Tax=Burkholderia pseudomallei TaxID=28450 RepID=UPI0009B5607C|nr:restriction endonuclease subunit S [Burkholderia pseudomallei]
MSNKDTSPMGKQKRDKQALVPRVRFPEFREAGEWENKPLRTLGSFFRGLTYSADEVSEEGLLVLRSSNIQDGSLVLDKDLVFVDKPCPDDLLLQDGDVAICMSNGSKALVGKSAEFQNNYDGQLTVGAFCSIFRPSLEFAKLIFQTPRYSKFVSIAIGGGNIKNLKNSDLEEFEHPVPRMPLEQQKIADCLAFLDELISAENQKLSTLKAHKKGMLQQLFPREGEVVPRLRFPAFRKAGAWAKVAVGQLFSNRTERGEQGLPIYSVTMTEGLVPRASLDRRIDDIAEAGANKAVRRGDIAYNMMRMWQGALGVAPEDCMVSPAYIVLEPQAGVDPVFFYFLLKRPETLQVLTAHSRGLTEDRLRLYYDDFAKVSLRCPSLPEQERIADCLASLDDSIAVQSQQIDALKTHKNGLMRQLFPFSAEVQA